MKRQLWNLRFGSKGFVFSLDIMVAVVVVMSMLAVSTFYITRAGSAVSGLQSIRIGSDILALLDHEGSLDSLSVEDMNVALNSLLPINYHMRIRVACIGRDPIVAETTDAFPINRFIGVGRRVFVTSIGRSCIADFSIWLK